MEEPITKRDFLEFERTIMTAINELKQFWLEEQKAIIHASLGYEVGLETGQVGWTPALEYTKLLRKYLNENAIPVNNEGRTSNSITENEENS
jgi:hypothetical protein